MFTSVDLPTPDEPSSAIVRPGVEVRANELEAFAGDVRDRVHGDAERDRLDLEHAQLPVGAEVGLRQHDHGLRAALPRHRDVALQAADVEVLVQRHDDEDGVDVRREHLLLGRVERDLARELRPPGEDVLDRRGSFVGPGGDRDPVADGRQLACAARLVREPAGRVSPQLAELGEEDVGAAVLRCDARGQQTARGVGFELGCVAVSPAEVLQCVQARLLEREVKGRARERCARTSDSRSCRVCRRT